jgi:hypothetical protein
VAVMVEVVDLMMGIVVVRVMLINNKQKEINTEKKFFVIVH